MHIDNEDWGPGQRVIKLAGRMDIAGTAAIEARFAELTDLSKGRVVVDLCGVVFLASIGIRALIIRAKELKSRQGDMVLYTGDNHRISDTLRTTGIDAFMPIFTDLQKAQKSVGN